MITSDERRRHHTELREAGAVAVYADPQALLDDFENSPLGRLARNG